MPPPRKNGEKKSFRLRTDQVDKEAAAKRARTRVFVDALKEASAFYEQQQMAGGVSGTRALSAAAVADKFSRDFPPDVPKLKGMRIRDHVVAGHAGRSPPGRGPKPAIPQLVVDIMASHTSMSQINGNELKPRAIRQNIAALVAGTDLEHRLKSKQQRAKFLKRLRQSGG